MSAPTPELRVVVHERRQLVRDRLVGELAAAPWVGAVSSSEEFRLTSLESPTAVLLCHAAASTNGIERIERVVRFDDWMPVKAVMAALRAGISSCTTDERQQARQRRTTPPQGTLTSRETAVLDAIADGESTAQIASRLRLAPKSVEGHKRRIFAKLGVQSGGHAVAVFRGYSPATQPGRSGS